MTEIHFTIDWSEIGKAVGYIVLGIGFCLGFVLWLFKDFTPYK